MRLPSALRGSLLPRPPPSPDGHGGRKRRSRFSWRTAEQAGHLLFEILVQVLAGRRRRLGTILGFEIEFWLRLWLKLRLRTRAEFALRRARHDVGPFARSSLTSQWIGYRRPAFRGRCAP